MSPDRDTTAIEQANAEAQRAFRAMLEARAVADPDAPETRAYTAAERRLDYLIAEARWEQAKSELDELIAADEGNHFAWPDLGVVGFR